MAVEHDCTIMLISVEHDGIMAENDQSVPVIQFGIMLDALPAVSQPTVDPIMIAPDQMLMSVEQLDGIYAVVLAFPESIPQHVDRILGRDPAVPVLNQHLAHFFYVRERPTIESEHVFVPHVHISNVVNHISFSVG